MRAVFEENIGETAEATKKKSRDFTQADISSPVKGDYLGQNFFNHQDKKKRERSKIDEIIWPMKFRGGKDDAINATINARWKGFLSVPHPGTHRGELKTIVLR